MRSKYFVKIIGVLAAAFVAVSCIVPYEPAELLHREGTLVVEGNISITGPFSIKITRSAPISAGRPGANNLFYENHALVYVRDEVGKIFLPDSVSHLGEYIFDFSDRLPDLNASYQLVIESPDGKIYESDLRKAKYSSDMELHYKIDTLEEKVSIFVDTYDLTGGSTYYHWQYEETWDYVSQIRARAFFDGSKVVETDDSNPWMYRCWNSSKSSNILLLETTSLSEDKIKDFLLQTIEYRNIRITQHYSIEVVQTVLDKDAYDYWQNMRKNSTEIGGLFSPQPNEISGNINCVSDPSVRAVGFVSVCNSVSKRLFVDCTSLPGYVRTRLPDDTLMSLSANIYGLQRLKQMGFSPYLVDNQMEVSYWNLTKCIDCRSKGGTPEVPPFWPPEWPRY
ncbi:MAG: DUF4249 domain-containing protein [Bacteroidales bacterium]|nr:DUF4249 domain-containing protein [Bacteroidales bacterium]